MTRVIDLSFLELPILIFEIMSLFFIMLLTHNYYGTSIQYVWIGLAGIVTIIWRLREYKGKSHQKCQTKQKTQRNSKQKTKQKTQYT